MVCEWATGQSKNRVNRRFPIPQTSLLMLLTPLHLLHLGPSATRRLTQRRSLVPIYLPGETNPSCFFNQPGPFPDLVNRGILLSTQADKAGQSFWSFQLNIPMFICWTLTNLGFVSAKKKLKRQFSADQLSYILGGVKTEHFNTLQRLRYYSPGSKHHFTAPQSGLQIWFAL